LDHVANGTVKDPRIGFAEPNLEFEVIAENKIRISTWVMASPVHPNTGPKEYLEISIDIPIELARIIHEGG
jgi:hypothetical protein